MTTSLEGKVIAVTGGLGTLGKALVASLLSHGARVAVLDRAEAAEQADPAQLLLGGVDVAEEADAARAVARIVEHFGGLDGLVNIAGGFRWETLESGSVESWDLLYRMNVRSAVVASRAALPHLLRRGAGRIVNVGAMGALKGATGMGAYAASKAGVMRLTEALADELKDSGITVNAVLPSIIDSEMNRRDMPKADFSRWVSPAALAEVMLFLLSERSAAVTGALLPVPGRV